jgi:5'-deoxynucleotidase YfbR-like HD superfamily hydrolase
MKYVDERTVDDIIALSAILGKFDQIKRATLLPDGSLESDSHHSFSLALIAYEVASEFAPELDKQKILLYALVHDLSELVTGDVNTLMATADELEEKRQRDLVATKEVVEQLTFAPHIAKALQAYEDKEDEESLFIYWLDKVVTIPMHFHDKGATLRTFGITTKQDARDWYERVYAKLSHEKGLGHESVVKLLEIAHDRLRDELL